MESDSSPQFRSIKARVSEKSLRLPEEIIEEILLRLPVKSLLKFRCVSKPCRSLIGSNRFIKKHLANSTKNPNFAHHNIIAKSVQPQLGLKQCYLISVLNDPLTAQFTSCYSMNIRWDSICIVDCCNGIVCLLLDRKHFMLWNPSTRKTKQLPPFDHNTRHERSITIHGFGYDDLSGDFMVLGMIIFPSDGAFGDRCKVYSLRTNSWKIVGDDNLSPFSNKGKFASGKIHWPCGYISYFDLRNEVFDVISPPITNGVCFRSMGVFGGRLGLLYDDGRGKLDIWVVKEYGVNASWEKVAILPYLHTTLDPGALYLSLLGISPNGEILLTGESSFEIFYPEGNGFRHCHGKDLGKFHEAVVYIESLVPL